MFGRIFLCLRFAWLHCLCFLDLLVSAVLAYIYVGGRCPHRPVMVYGCQNGTMRASSPAMKIFFVNTLAKINEMCYNNSATHFNSIRYTLETNNMISLKVGKNVFLAWTGYIIVLPESIS